MGMYRGGEMIVTVNREELLERLEENRKRHAETYQLALARWQADLAQMLKVIDVSDATSFPSKLTNMGKKCPQSHLNEYDRVIDMFSMSVSENIELDNTNFNCYCRDEWDWKRAAMSNSYYMGAFAETSAK